MTRRAARRRQHRVPRAFQRRGSARPPARRLEESTAGTRTTARGDSRSPSACRMNSTNARNARERAGTRRHQIDQPRQQHALLIEVIALPGSRVPVHCSTSVSSRSAWSRHSACGGPIGHRHAVAAAQIAAIPRAAAAPPASASRNRCARCRALSTAARVARRSASRRDRRRAAERAVERRPAVSGSVTLSLQRGP